MAKPRPVRQAEQAETVQTPRIERRAWIRYPTARDTFCQPRATRKDRDLWWQAQIRDISAGGIGLVLNRSFPPGTILSVELPTTPHSPLILLLARVVHATAQADGAWLIGCEFARQLRDDDLQALSGVVAPAPPSAAGDNGTTEPPANGSRLGESRTQRPRRPPGAR